MREASVGLCVPLSLLSNNSVKTFSRHRIIIGGAFFVCGAFLMKAKYAISCSQKFYSIVTL
jgi:hypothetical protein